MTTETKKCINCFEVKTINSFNEKIKGKGLYQSWCKDCNAEVQRAYQKRRKENIRRDKVKHFYNKVVVFNGGRA